MDEEWRVVVDFKGLYEVSSEGRVRNIRRNGRILGGTLHRFGYRQVCLTAHDGTSKTRLVHTLVLQAFVGPRPTGHVTDHLNGTKTDNRLANLEYVVPAENARRASRLGLLRPFFKPGDGNFNAKLNRAKVKEIRALGLAGVRPCAVARKFGVTDSTVHSVLAHRTWKHVA